MQRQPTLWIAAFALLGCDGLVSQPGRRLADGSPQEQAPDSDVPSSGPASDLIPPTTRFSDASTLRLLTPREYTNTVRDLLGVNVDTQRLPDSTPIEGHGKIAGAQAIGYDEVDAYYAVASEVAAAVVASELEACSPDDGACFADFAVNLLDKAFRLPVSEDAQRDFLSILENSEAGSGYGSRLEVLITSVLSSPRFLYRNELSAADSQLSGRQIAVRLSYLIGESTPDEMLLDRADNGSLLDSEARIQELDRLLSSPDGRRAAASFVLDWMAVNGDEVSRKDPEVLEGTSALLPSLATESLIELAQHILFEESGRLTDLLSAASLPLNRELGRILGVAIDSESLEMTELNSEQRLGILTHPAVLAAHSKESGASPFLVGEFIYTNVLCESIGSPPVVPEVEAPEAAGETLRERLESATAPPSCQLCHKRIGPSGFAFLPFDPIGRYDPDDDFGQPYDTAGSIPVGDETIEFRNAPELASTLASADRSAQCLARRVFRWAYGRFEGASDEEEIQRLEKVAVESGSSWRDLLVAVVSSERFVLNVGGNP
ncbi:MAG: DUF1588 domain-containing protein [Myxococcota bacterium]